MTTVIGAVLGAIVGYLFFTDRDRRWRQQVDHALDELARELDRARRPLHAAGATVDEGGTRPGEHRIEQKPSPQELRASTVGASP